MSLDGEFLSQVPFFQGLDDVERQALAQSMDLKILPKGERIFLFGDQGDALYIVRQGQVELFVKDHTGEKITLRFVDAGQMFGELSMLDNGPRTATAETSEDSELLVLGQDDLLAFLRNHPDAAIDLLAALGGRIRQTNRLLMGRVSRNSNTEVEEKLNWVQRIANLIAEFSGSMSFLVMNTAFFVVWILWNVDLIPSLKSFDPYPFGFLT